MGRNTRYLIIIPAVLFALFAKPAKADTLGEWTYSQSCPTSGSVEVADDTITLTGPDQEGCAGQPHWVKIETTIPADVDTIDFTWEYQTNDGWNYDPPQYGINEVYTLLTQQNNSTGELSVPVEEGDVFTFRQYSTDTCCQPGILTISNLSLWESITTSTTSTTTSTTTAPSTTVPVTVTTTTTVPETSTSSSTTTTSTTTTTSSTTSTTTTSTTVVLPESSTSSSTTTSSVPQTTLPVLVPTTTVQPEPSTSTTYPTTVQTTVPTVATVPPTVAPVPATTTTVVETTTTSTTTSTTVPESTTSTTVKPPVETTTTTSVAPTTSVQITVAPTTTLQMSEVLENILTSSNEEVAALATSPQVLATVSTEEAAQIFEALDVGQLTDTQVDQLVEAVQNAPDAVREEFEDNVDIFGEGLDDYVPVGSTIPVGERRTLIAVTAGITIAAAGTRIRR